MSNSRMIPSVTNDYEPIMTEDQRRRERIIETARRIFEATASDEYTYAAKRIRSAFLCAEAFEDAADEYRKGVNP